MSTDHDPLTDAELDQLASLAAARTPGRLCVAVSSRGEYGIFGGPDGEEWIATLPRGRSAEAEAFVAMANALPALLAEVRAARSAPSPSLAAALDAYGRAYCRAAHLDTQARRTALADAERAVLRCVEGAATVDPDGPRLHIPADLLTRPAGGGVR